MVCYHGIIQFGTRGTLFEGLNLHNALKKPTHTNSKTVIRFPPYKGLGMWKMSNAREVMMEGLIGDYSVSR